MNQKCVRNEKKLNEWNMGTMNNELKCYTKALVALDRSMGGGKVRPKVTYN